MSIEGKHITIDISENGYVVTDILTTKTYVFTSSKKMRDWLKDNLAATGETERFVNALDDDKKSEYHNVHKILDQMYRHDLMTSNNV